MRAGAVNSLLNVLEVSFKAGKENSEVYDDVE